MPRKNKLQKELEQRVIKQSTCDHNFVQARLTGGCYCTKCFLVTCDPELILKSG